MLGIDIERVSRFKLKQSSPFLQAHFTEQEISFAFSKTQPHMHLCGMFCAKEAVKKALGGPAVHLRDIEITHMDSGAPQASIQKNNVTCMISISHSDEYAVANAMLHHEK